MKNTNKNPIFKNCKDCLYVNTCIKYEGCSYLKHENKDDYAERLLESLKKNITCSPTSKFESLGSAIDSYNGERSTYEYYRQMINGCLRDIRQGRTAYVFKEEHVKDILRFEPDINLSYKDGIFYITL